MKETEKESGGGSFPQIDWTYMSIGSDKAANTSKKI